MTALTAAAVVVAVAATGLADVRWLRAAQREHYLAGSATRFAVRWWTLGPNRLLAVAAIVGVAVSPVSPLTGVGGALAVAMGPFRYSLRGRAPGPVVWTPRLRGVALVTGGSQALVVAAGLLLGIGVPVACVIALTAPLTIDAALAGLRPWEDHKAARFVDQATARLKQVAPTVVGITGSYGKTTTKVYAAHLIRGAKAVVPTPASFNNRAGLSRAINEHLTPGTDVFIAEMGTYGKGEIAELCAWCPPSVAAITAIGPVHLERFGSEDAIVEAKSEIFGAAETAVLNVDDARLAELARRLEGVEVIRCSAVDEGADVCVRVSEGRLVLFRGGRQVAEVRAPDAVAGNVAVAAALAFAVGVGEEVVAAALESLPPVANRRTTTQLSTGATAIDDTFNSNPAGCAAALERLGSLAEQDRKRVVVTPGMVELGNRQAGENATFAEAAARSATHLIVVGFTNRKALLAGVDRVPKDERAEVMVADRHEHAVSWVREHTATGDVVLYENQLPDIYP